MGNYSPLAVTHTAHRSRELRRFKLLLQEEPQQIVHGSCLRNTWGTKAEGNSGALSAHKVGKREQNAKFVIQINGGVRYINLHSLHHCTPGGRNLQIMPGYWWIRPLLST
ncbi:hypothetical protein K438DRAFT_1162546 [Mycena galopus ATCC 62051]|nr:hypothetical protein K438DRAFT_1162546 [Mycena galopus ATCC 62051]